MGGKGGKGGGGKHALGPFYGTMRQRAGGKGGKGGGGGHALGPFKVSLSRAREHGAMGP